MLPALVETIRKTHEKILPNTGFSARAGALGQGTVFIRVYLGKIQTEMPGGIIQNDPLNVCFTIHLSDQADKVDLEPAMSVGRLKPTQPYYAMSSEKIKCRRLTATPEKVASRVADYLQALKDKLAELDSNDRFLDGLSYRICDKIK